MKEYFFEQETSFQLFTEDEWKEQGSYYGIYYFNSNYNQVLDYDFIPKKFSYLTPEGKQVYVNEISKIPKGNHIKVMGKSFGGSIFCNI